MTLGAAEKQAIREEVTEAVQAALDVRRQEIEAEAWPDAETRHAHHRFIAEWIKRQEQKRETWNRIKGNVIVALVVMVFSGLGTAGMWIWEHVVSKGGPSG